MKCVQLINSDIKKLFKYNSNTGRLGIATITRWVLQPSLDAIKIM